MKLLPVLLILSLMSCSKKSVPLETGSEVRDYEKEKFVRATVVDMTGLDGCRFLLSLEDGKKLEPINLEPAYKKDNLPVWIRYIDSKDAMSICMAARMVRIIDI